MGITAKELAAKLNLSPATVSMVLNNKPGISTETRKNVIQMAEKYGYDFSRLSLKKMKSGNICCVIYRMHNAILNYMPIFSEITDGIEQECRRNDYRLKMVQIYGQKDDVFSCINELKESGCDGIIFLGTEANSSVIEPFLQTGIPFILLDTCFDSMNCSSVSINNVQGAYLAVSYLIAHCGRQPGHLCSSYQIKNFRERKTGFDRAVREHGMSIGKTITHELVPSIEGAYVDMLEIIDRGDELAGCYFADNDLIAIGAMKAFRQRGYKIPEDIAVIGFDNISEGQVVDPALTTIDIPRYFMGQTAARQLIWQMINPVPHTIKIEVSTSVVKRLSV